ncbi:hypothetical protein [Aquirhabdus parva]|uniref:hypothetical protein n=1 Tax=Aquirhabdus parva TaxID=2283318 RepID=UPI0013B45C0A|nr:hypothetical protein [Aquirhabdus parva]
MAMWWSLEVQLVAHLKSGRSKGCTTWTMKVNEAGKTLKYRRQYGVQSGLQPLG